MKRKLLLAALTLCIGHNLYSQNQVDTLKIDEVTIIKNKSQEAVLKDPQIEPISLLPSTSTISRLDIEKQGSNTLIDAMKYTTGAWTESRGRKVKQMFSTRGQSYPYPSYSVNGFWQKEFSEITYFLNSSNIESITIDRSSSALLNSISSLTGVIDVKLKQPTERETNIYAKYGSLNTYSTGVSFADAKEDFNYTISVNGNGTNGPTDRHGKESIWNAMASFNWDITEKLTLNSNFFYIYGKRQLVQPIEPADSKFRDKYEEYKPYKAAIAQTKLNYKISDKLSSDLMFSYAGRQPLYTTQGLNGENYKEYKETDNEFTVNWINAQAISSKNTLRYGLLYNFWNAPNGKRYYVGKPAKVHTASAVVTDQHSFGKLLLDVGFRISRQYYSEWGGFSIEGAAGPFSKVQPIKNEWQSPEWEATSGLSYMISKKSSLHANFSAGVITPRTGALTDEGLKPNNETRLNVDLGYIASFNKGSKLTVTSFLVNRFDAISFSGGTVETNDDIIVELYKNANMRSYGLEVEYKSPRMFDALSLFTNATLMNSEIVDDNEWTKDDEIPNFIANLGLNFDKSNFDANAYVHYTSKYQNDRFMSKSDVKKYGKAPLGDFVTLDLTAGYSFGKDKNFRAFVEVDNVFDTKYQTCVGFPDYGRIMSIGINLRFK